jgi:subtilisin family serine protease
MAGRIKAAYALRRSSQHDWSDLVGHGTHTAGSIIGNGAMSSGQYRGVAWEAWLVHQSIGDSGDYVYPPPDLNDLFLPTYTDGARVHSDSWGSAVNGAYDANAIGTDAFMWNYPAMLVVYSAGNSGVDANPANGVVDADSMGSPGTAKNALTVGAMENDRPPGSGGISSYNWGDFWYSEFPLNPINGDSISYSYTNSPYRQGMAAFSSRGPTDDGRIKPDVVAPGTDIISTRSRSTSGTGWGIAANTNYLYMGGTSMSAPLVAGAAALVRQYLVERAGHTNPSAALVKAMLIGGARAMYPGQYGTNAYLEIPIASPNGVEGFGQVDVGASVYPTGLVIRCLDWQILATGQVLTNLFTVAASNAPLTVTLAWSDYPGTAGSGITLINDLDLTLEGPTGSIYNANEGTNADRRNTVEVIRLPSAAAGPYKVCVTGYNVPVDTQRCALVIRAAMDLEPVLRYTPPEPVLLTTNALPVTALVTYYASLTNGEVRLCWTTNAAAGIFNVSPFVWGGGHVYTSAIPSQELGTLVSYYLSATVSVYDVRYPTNAPNSLVTVSFSAPDVSLDIDGNRTNSTVVTPSYGHYTYPSGFLVHAWAQSLCTSGTTWQFVCRGWNGTGTWPTGDVGALANVTLTNHAVLTWLWDEEAQFLQNSSPTGAVNDTSWRLKDSPASTVTAPPGWNSATNAPYQYSLAGWKVDNVPWNDGLGRSPNPATNIVMSVPHTATAWYLPFWTDSDTNGLLDWWEYRWFGTTGVAQASADTDGDGWNNRQENLDATNPTDSNSVPTAPSIFFTPLASNQTSLPPWAVSATITDNWTVAGVALLWRVNGGSLRTNVMTTAGAGVYFTTMDPGVSSVVTASYQVAAADYVFSVTTAVYTLESSYPLFRMAPTNFGTIRLPRTGLDTPVTVANDGNQPMPWEALALAPQLQDNMERGTNGWVHEGYSDSWHLSKLRFSSASNAWYCGSDATRQYSDGMNIFLVSTSVTLGAGGFLGFHHWMRAEPNGGNYFWDGGVVKITTNDGLSYSTITPIGGYPHRIVPNDESPFNPDTPCFGSNDWREDWVDLASYSGKTVRVAFVFGSDLLMTAEGWYIDDVWLGSAVDPGWMTLTGAVSAIFPGITERQPFALTVNARPLQPQADVSGRIRVNHPGSGRELDVAPFRLRRPAFITTESDPQGTVQPAQADLLDAESTTMTVSAATASRIMSVTTNGIPVPAVFGIGSTQYLWHVYAPATDLAVTARYTRVWSVSLTLHGPGLAQPSESFPLDALTATTVLFQADAGQQIWSLLVAGTPVSMAGGQASYSLSVPGVTTNLDVLAAFGGATLTGLPVSVESAWMRQYYPSDWDFNGLALLDTDGDGMVTWQEYVARTIPTNPASVLMLDQPPAVSNGATFMSVDLHFLSVSGRTYQAQTAPEVTGPWGNTGSLVTATGAFERLQVELPSSVSRAFFRVLVQP